MIKRKRDQYDAWTFATNPREDVLSRSDVQTSFRQWYENNKNISRKALADAAKFNKEHSEADDVARLSMLDSYRMSDAVLAWYWEDAMREEAVYKTRDDLIAARATEQGSFEVEIVGSSRKHIDDAWENRVVDRFVFNGTRGGASDYGFKILTALNATKPDLFRATGVSVGVATDKSLPSESKYKDLVTSAPATIADKLIA